MPDGPSGFSHSAIVNGFLESNAPTSPSESCGSSSRLAARPTRPSVYVSLPVTIRAGPSESSNRYSANKPDVISATGISRCCCSHFACAAPISASLSFLAIQALFRNAVEERAKAVEILLREGIVFMIVAPRAAQCHAQPGGRGGLDAIHNVLVLVLLRNRAALKIDHVIPIEAGRDDLRLR